MKGTLLSLNHAVILFGSTLYCGVLWSLHFFWFPTWTNLKVDNYYNQFIPQTTAATSFFTVVVPIVFLCLLIMAFSEWKTRFRWVPIAGLVLLAASTGVGQMLIIPINKTLAQGISDQAQLSASLERWMSLNDFRWVTETLAWLVMMYYFIAKGELPARINEAPA